MQYQKTQLVCFLLVERTAEQQEVSMKRLLLVGISGIVMLGSVPVLAVSVTLDVVASYARTGPFGLAYDGTNLWWSQSDGSIHEMTTSGVDTGNVITGLQWSALAFNGVTGKIVVAGGGGITSVNRATTGTVASNALNPTFQAIAGGPSGLIDGLDIQGDTLWWSPDVDLIYSSKLDGSGNPSTFLSGTYSGVEYLTAGSHDFLIVVNDGSNPRKLCVHETSNVLIGCATLANDRYDDLAYDGKYLDAADYFGNKIDKIGLLVDGVIIGGGVPEPASWALMVVGFVVTGVQMRRRATYVPVSLN
jgi:hypothetical protein